MSNSNKNLLGKMQKHKTRILKFFGYIRLIINKPLHTRPLEIMNAARILERGS